MNSQNQAENKLVLKEIRPNTHSFDTDIAKQYDVDIAIMYKHMTYWVNYNKNLNTNFYEGRYWFYNTLEEIAAHFEYWSVDQVKRIIKKMLDLNLILKGNFNKTSFDRTVWYTINCQIDLAKSPNGLGGIAKPIPNTNTNIYNKEIYKEKGASIDAGAEAPPQKFKINISDEQKNNLIKKIGKDKTEYYIEAIENHVLSIGKPNKYKSHYHTILSWNLRDEKKKPKLDKSEEVKEKNVRWLKDKIKSLEAINARGNLKLNNEEAIDSVLNKRISLYSQNLIDMVSSWDQFRR